MTGLIDENVHFQEILMEIKNGLRESTAEVEALHIRVDDTTIIETARMLFIILFSKAISLILTTFKYKFHQKETKLNVEQKQNA